MSIATDVLEDWMLDEELDGSAFVQRRGCDASPDWSRDHKDIGFRSIFRPKFRLPEEVQSFHIIFNFVLVSLVRNLFPLVPLLLEGQFEFIVSVEFPRRILEFSLYLFQSFKHVSIATACEL